MTSTPSRSRLPLRLGAAVGALALFAGLGACSSKDDAKTVDKASTTTSSAADGATTGTTGVSVVDSWTADAQVHQGKDGETFDYTCTPKGTADTIWGVETYTDDSSVCTAAVHVGLITLEKGGEVTIEIAPGQGSYDAGTANGITSVRYGSWPGSFTFPDAAPGTGKFELIATDWSASVKSLGLDDGDSRVVTCTPKGTIGSVWGSGPFTADSSICTAALLSGKITEEKGGDVRVTVTPGEDAYTGSTANGVTSSDYGSYSLSFTIDA